MAKSTDRTLVFRAEFKDRLTLRSGGGRIIKGGFVVEILLWKDRPRMWAALVNGDKGDMITCASTPALTMRRTRAYFVTPVCDWVVGTKVDGQWRPVDDVTLGVK